MIKNNDNDNNHNNNMLQYSTSYHAIYISEHELRGGRRLPGRRPRDPGGRRRPPGVLLQVQGEQNIHDINIQHIHNIEYKL